MVFSLWAGQTIQHGLRNYLMWAMTGLSTKGYPRCEGILHASSTILLLRVLSSMAYNCVKLVTRGASASRSWMLGPVGQELSDDLGAGRVHPTPSRPHP